MAAVMRSSLLRARDCHRPRVDAHVHVAHARGPSGRAARGDRVRPLGISSRMRRELVVFALRRTCSSASPRGTG